MPPLTDRRRTRQLTLLCVTVYFASYIMRINYTAVLVEFIQTAHMARDAASLVATVGLFACGAGQLLSGLLGDHISPVWMFSGGLLATSVMNLLLPVVTPHAALMTLVWGVNGVAQAFIWPPTVKILVCALPHDRYDRAITNITFGCAAGTVTVYLVAPLLIRLSGWQAVFYGSAGLGLVSLVFWVLLAPPLLRGVSFHTVRKKRAAPPDAAPLPLHEQRRLRALLRLLPVILVATLIQGMLRDGISAWAPPLLTETFGLKSTVSILTTVVLPVAYVVGNCLIVTVLRRLHNNVLAGVCVYFAGTTAFLLLQALLGTKAVWLSVFCLTGASGMAYSVNIMQTCCLPADFRALGRDSLIAGALNFFSYGGSALSTYLFAVLSEHFGWGWTLWSWALLSLAGLLLGLCCLLRMRRHRPPEL